MKHNFFVFYSSFKRHKWMAGVVMFALFLVLGLLALPRQTTAVDAGLVDPIGHNAQQMLAEGRQIFRYDTFGDQAFWGDTLKLRKAVAQLSPNDALAVGLKVDTARSTSMIRRTPSYS